MLLLKTILICSIQQSKEINNYRKNKQNKNKTNNQRIVSLSFI